LEGEISAGKTARRGLMSSLFLLYRLLPARLDCRATAPEAFWRVPSVVFAASTKP
jgi:hypothetical protein